MSVTIDPESLITPPKWVEWQRVVNFRPGNGDAVDFNPPRFSWSYTPDPSQAYADTTIRSFVLEIADNTNFTSPVVSQACDYNFYNFLAPLASGTWYWRVVYKIGGSFEVNSATRSFVITGSEPEWDRSMLADEDYLSTQNVHPRILFNAGNRSAVLSAVQAVAGGAWWTVYTNVANTVIAEDWCITPALPDFGTVDENSWIAEVLDTAFVYGLTQNSDYANVGALAALYADRYVAQGFADEDEVSDGRAKLDFLALCYDWAFDTLDSTQKGKIQTAIAARCTSLMTNGTWDDHTGPSPKVNVFSMKKQANAHGFANFQNAFIGPLATYGEDSMAREYFDFTLAYMIAMVTPFGTEGTINQGRGYLTADFLTTVFTLRLHMLSHLCFPDASLNQHPFWPTLAEWLDAFIPVGHSQLHEPWGDATTGGVTYWASMRELALYTGSGAAYRHYENQLALPPSSGDRGNEDFYSLIFPYYFSAPTAADSTPGVTLYPDFGVVGATVAPNTAAGFTDGLGFVFQVRPRGSEGGHSHFSDGSFQLWAYGAPITDGGAGFVTGPFGYDKVPYSHYTLLVNGLGTVQPFEAPVEAIYSKVVAKASGMGYEYVCADLTKAYPQHSFTPSGADLPGDFIANHTGAPLAALVKVRRHLLFLRNKYWIVFDELEHGENATFSWLYHVAPDTLTLDSPNKKWTYTVPNTNSDDVTVYVAHIGSGAGITITDLTGPDVASNPHTGEDYYTAYGDTNYRAHALWVENATPATSFSFLSVIYPSAPSGLTPTITRIDDRTVQVSDGVDDDTISFDPNNTTADFIITTTGEPEPSMSDNLVLNQTSNSDPVTELVKRAAVTAGVAGTLTEEVIHHSGDYPSQPNNDYVYAKHGTDRKHVFVFDGTITLSAAIAARP